MIKPTIGRVVLFHPMQIDPDWPKEVHAAVICKVHEGGKVNLCAFDGNGRPYNMTHIEIMQAGAQLPEFDYCEIRPFENEAK